MGNNSCPSPATEGRGRRPLLVPVLALLFQPVPPGLLWAVSSASYAEPPRLAEAGARAVSLCVLALSAGVSLALGALGAYQLLTRSRPAVAGPLILFCCAPA